MDGVRQVVQVEGRSGRSLMPEGFNRVLGSVEDAQISFAANDDLEGGYCERTIVSPSIEIMDRRLHLKQSLSIDGITSGAIYTLHFCLGKEMNWQVQGNRHGDIQLREGEGLLCRTEGIAERGYFAANHHYHGFSLVIQPAKFEMMLENAGFTMRGSHHTFDLASSHTFAITPEVRFIMQQMMQCPYNGSLRKLYLEGKVMEIVAVSIDATLMAATERKAPGFSRTELDSLHRARAMLDNRLDTPPTLAELARLVSLNEYKLKSGFKLLFERPVYQYVLEQRMKLGRYLLEVRQLSVGQVAEQVGYSSSHHFSRAFQKTYGFNPSDCLHKGK